MNREHHRQPIIDLHEDLFLHINRPELFPNGTSQTDFKMLEAIPVKVVIASAFPVPPAENWFDLQFPELVEADFSGYLSKAENDPKWDVIKSRSELSKTLAANHHGIIMHIEGLNVLDADPWPRLEKWHSLGWRSLGIVWNVTNPLGGGTLEPEKGLTSLGADVLNWAEHKQILIDCAHMNPTIFKDALATTKGPVFISHGNCHHCCPTPRNYTDDQLRAVATRGGIIGPFFSKKYVRGDNRAATIEDAVSHFKHLRNVVGVAHMALGTDFGGITTGFVEQLTSVTELPNLWKALREARFSDEDLDRIAWRNAANFLSLTLPD